MRKDVLNFSNETEREKLLHTVIYYLSLSNTKFRDQLPERGAFVIYDEPKIGDLVIGNCGEIGYLVNISPNESSFMTVYTIQVLGTEKLIDWSNESFKKITGIHQMYLLEGEERDFKEFVEKTFSEYEEISYMHYFSGIVFKEKDAVVTVRKRILGGSYELQIKNFRRIKSKRGLKRILIREGWGQRGEK